MQPQTPYIPISCQFHDYIEHYATLRRLVEIRYWEAGQRKYTKSRILSTCTENGAEYLILEVTPFRLRLDQLIAIETHELIDFQIC